MYNGIGLQTPRGSGTNGYIQSNRFFVRSKTNKVVNDSKGFESGQGTAGMTRKPNQEILEHDRKRHIEVKLLELEDKLSDQGYTDAEIAEKLDEARISLEAKGNEDGGKNAERVSETQTHQIAALKERQMETLKAALGIESEADREKKFLDMETLNIEENLNEAEKDDMRKIAKETESGKGEAKRHNKEKTKRRHEYSSDSDSIGRHQTKEKHKKVGKVAVKSDDSDIDVRKRRKESSRKHKKVTRHDSSSSESDDPDSGSEPDSDKDYKKSRRRDSNDDYNSGRSPKSRNQKLKKPLKNKRHDSDDDSFEGGRVRESKKSKNRQHDSYDKYSSAEGPKQLEKAKEPRKRRGIESDGDYTSDEVPKNKNQKGKEPFKGRRHDSDDDSFEGGRVRESKKSKNGQHDSYDKYSSDEGPKQLEKAKEPRKKRGIESDDDYTSDEVPKNKNRKGKELSKGRRHDSDDEFYDDRLEKDEINRSKKMNQQRAHKLEDPRENSRSNRGERRDEVGGRYGQKSDSDSGEGAKNRRERYDRGEFELNAGHGSRQERNDRRNRANDSSKYDNHKSDDASKYDNRKGDDAIERNRDSDRNRDRVEVVKSLQKQSSGYGGDAGAKRGERDYAPETGDRDKQKNKVDGLDMLKKLEQLFQSKGDGSGDKSEDMTRGKRKIDDGSLDEEPEPKYRKRDTAKESGYEGTKVPSERQSKSYKPTEDNIKDSKPVRHIGNVGVGDPEDKTRRGRIEPRHEDRRESPDQEGPGRSKRDRGDEEDCRGRKHERQRDEDSYKRDGDSHRGVRGREKEEERASVRDERDGEYPSKRARYDEGRSSGRRYDDDRDEYRRSRRR